MKSSAERSIEALTWAAVVIWLGFSLVTHILGYAWLVVMVLGIILLSSAIYQRSRGWHTSLTIWIAGIWMAVFSVVEVSNAFIGALNNGEGLSIDIWVYLGIALVSMGVAVVLRNVQTPSVPRNSRANARSAEADRPYIPRQVQDDTSYGRTSAPQQATSASWSTSSRQPARTQRDAPPEPRARQAPSRGRSARPADEPADLEARVDDIIRRSRERRNRDNLPY